MNDQPASPDEVDKVTDDPPPTPKHLFRPADGRQWVVESDSVAQGEDLDHRDLGRARRTQPSAAAPDGEIPLPSETTHDGGELDEHGEAVTRWREQSKQRKKKRPFWVELPILIVIAFALTFLIQTFIAKVYYVPSGSMEKTLHGVSSGGDRILASKIVYDFRDPRQGDVVVFKGPDTWDPEASIPGPSSWFGKAMQSLGSVIGIAPPNEKDFVKRVIAVGGQTVACCDKQGNVTVDGRSLSEPYIFEPLDFLPGQPEEDCTVDPGDPNRYTSSRCFAPYQVPAGQLWVMGDHRSASSDSSYLCQGRTPAGEKAFRTDGLGTDCNRPIPADNVIGKAIVIVMPPSRWGTIGDPDIDPGNPALSSGPVAALPVSGGVLITAVLRGGLAMMPTRRRRLRRPRRWAVRRSGRPR